MTSYNLMLDCQMLKASNGLLPNHQIDDDKQIGKKNVGKYIILCTGKSLSEALIFASTNPQYDDRLFIELQVQYMKIPSSNLGRTCCVQKLFLTFRTIFVHNMFSPCSAKRRASDKDLPVLINFITWWEIFFKFFGLLTISEL